MRVVTVKDYKAMSKKAALIVASQIILKKDSVLGLATGSTPKGMYKELIKMYQDDKLDFSNVKTFNLDEYIGLSKNHPQSYNYYMNKNFFNFINIQEKNIHLLDGKNDDIKKECSEYDMKIERSGGIDLQVLGIGANGHIGFNEPRKRLFIKTHQINLSQKTISDNSRFFNSQDEVPSKAITVGISTILKSKRILLLASGENKAEAIKETISGYVSTQVPSSLLQTHPEVIIIIDKAASKLL